MKEKGERCNPTASYKKSNSSKLHPMTTNRNSLDQVTCRLHEAGMWYYLLSCC
ncbi:unnamed protein product [Hymenolepis diminuta]|uniref:Uncharacterized protein n=1 Tax=Hymenolepis diminuta TaxID=6216 RepID=A0A564XVF1_HYMDI|nr:unnamed protein product [Hymenolepis diminuta]